MSSIQSEFWLTILNFSCFWRTAKAFILLFSRLFLVVKPLWVFISRVLLIRSDKWRGARCLQRDDVLHLHRQDAQPGQDGRWPAGYSWQCGQWVSDCVCICTCTCYYLHLNTRQHHRCTQNNNNPMCNPGKKGIGLEILSVMGELPCLINSEYGDCYTNQPSCWAPCLLLLAGFPSFSAFYIIYFGPPKSSFWFISN